MEPTCDARLMGRCCYADGRARGVAFEDSVAFARYLGVVVAPRVQDDGGLEGTLQALATTGMETTFIANFLQSVPPQPWEIGEALAECVLAEEMAGRVVWPWNTVWDRRTPRASLPGADLVGFHVDEGETRLLLGEVKTSSDASVPPNVMHGTGGMEWQLAANAEKLGIQHSIVLWLHARCKTGDMAAHFRAAMTRFLRSEGRDIAVVGVLLRDTAPAPNDVVLAARKLVKRLAGRSLSLFAWYLPIPVDAWPSHLTEVAP